MFASFEGRKGCQGLGLTVNDLGCLPLRVLGEDISGTKER